MRNKLILKNRNVLFVAVMSAMALGSVHPVSADAQDLVLDGTDTQTINTTQDLGTNAVNVGVSNGSSATLTIDSGGVLSNGQSSIGVDAGSEGTVIVTGTGTWTSSSVFTVGENGAGTLTVSDGGTVTGGTGVVGDSLGSTGTVTVTGEGSTWNMLASALFVGNSGAGSLTIDNGGAVTSGSAVTLGKNGSGDGTILVAGAGSTLNTGDFFVGSAGTGALTVSDGATASGFSGSVGADLGASGTVSVTGDGSAWNLSGGTLFVGDSGAGTLTIDDGGTVTTTNLVNIGRNASGDGTVIVAGVGSSLSSADLVVGGAGTGLLRIESGAAVTSHDGQLGAVGGSGTVLVSGSGSTWTMGGGMAVGDSVGTGALTIADGGKVSANTGIRIAPFAGSTGTVSVTGTDATLTSASDLLVAGGGNGTLTIADGGTVNVAGTVTLAMNDGSAGTLNIGAAAGDAAVAAGTLHADAIQFGNVDGTLVFNHTDTAYDFSADMSGLGAIQQLAGTTDLTGDSSGFTGQVTITGGTLNVTGQLGSSGGVIAGSTEDAAVNVSGAGANWINSTGLAVGLASGGALTVSDGGSVSDSYSFVGYGADSTGTATITGAGSTWSHLSTLYVGVNGDGTLTLSDGGEVHTGGTVIIASQVGSTGTLNIGAAAGDAAVAAGTLDTNWVTLGSGNASIVFNHTETDYNFNSPISGAGTLEQIAGVTDLTGDTSGFTGTTHVTGGTLKVNDTLGGTVNVTGGTLGGSGTLSGNVTVTGGAIAPGNSPGTLTIGGDLALAAGSSLDFQLGSPAGTAGTDSDLIDVGGNLTLDGTLNVADAGGFGAGLYRLINYGGTLTDNGLEVGAGPAGYNSTNLNVQTATAGQVNLLAGMPVTSFSFWDGANTGANGAVDGGTATWTATGTHWTVADGSANGAFDPAALLIFAGTPGTVTVDDGAGAISIRNGMQFAVDGYAVTGDAIGLTGASVIRVGDGTAAGAGYTATIAAPLTGTGSLEKTDLGTLVLTVANTYTGGTLVNFGTLAVDGGSISHAAANLIVGNVSDADGALSIEHGGTVSNASGIIGDVTGGVGSTGKGAVSVTGAGSTWTNAGELNVGFLGTGTLTIADGGSVSNTQGLVGGDAGGTGAVTVMGTGSSWANSGDLHVGNSGAGTLTIENGGAVSDAQGYIGSNAGSTGTVTVTGTGSTWTHSLDLIVGSAGSGMLTAADGGTVSSRFGVIGDNADGAVTVTGENAAWTNALDLYVGTNGSGTLTVADGGTVSNDFGIVGYNAGSTGAVKVTGASATWTSASELVIGNSGSGTLTIGDGGTVAASGTVTLGRVAGSAGTLNIGAAAGDMAVAAGTLNVAQLEFGAGAGTVNFNHTDTDYDFDPAMSGTGSLNQIAGVTLLAGDSSGFTGTTTITGGTLRVNNTLGGTVNVSGGTLGGSGMLGNVTIASGGTLAPGNSIGTLNVANATFDAGSTYAVQLDDGGFVAGTDNDLLNTSGTATIHGGAVQVTPENGTDDGSTYTPGTYTILTAAGGVSGTFDALTDDYAFLDFALGYDANHVFLTSSLVSSGFCLTGMSANQCAVGNAAFSQGAGRGVFDTLLTLSGTEAPAALDQLSGEIHASTKTALLQDDRFTREAALGRLSGAQGYVEAQSGQVTRKTSGGGTFWSQGFGAWSRWNGDRDVASMKRNVGGLLIGGDTRVADDVTLGLMGGYSHTSLHLDDRHSSAAVDSRTFGAYAGDAWGAFSLKGGMAAGWHDIDTSRSIAFTGFADGLHASYKAQTFQAYSEAAYGIESSKTRLEPFVSVAYETLHTDGYRESGGAAALTAGGQKTHATFSMLGLRAETPLALGASGARLTGSLGWRRAYGSTPTTTQRFASGGDAFTVDGVALARNVLAVDAGFELDLTESATMRLSYNGQFGSGVSDQGARLGFSVNF